MINRVLIRIKVIQILYSCLLVGQKFTLEEQPSEASKERGYAYRLYIDLLALAVMLSRQIEYKKSKPLQNTRFMRTVADEDRVRRALAALVSERAVDQLVLGLADKVKESGLYKGYLKDMEHGDAGAEDTFWRECFRQIIFPDAGVAEYAESLDSYSMKGMERAQEMVADTLTGFATSQDSLPDALKTLAGSLDEAHDLYFRMLALAVDLTYRQERRLEDGRRKKLPTPEDLNPNMRFVENRAIAALQENETFAKYVEKHKIDWNGDNAMVMDMILKAVVNSDVYREYMEAPESDMKRDAELWRDLFRKVILCNRDFLEYLEDKSVFWNDDVEIMGTFVMKTFRRIEEGAPDAVTPKFKDDEDRDFGPQLLRYVYGNRERYEEWIARAVENSEWKADRLAFMDVVVIMTALAEMLNFPKIPLNVTLNEYIEIAKSYGSAKSGQFVNGLLASLIRTLQEDRVLLKK